MSATPGPFELSRSKVIAEQLIRPTGIVDPEVELRPTKNQIDDLLNEIRRARRGRRAHARHHADEEDVRGSDRTTCSRQVSVRAISTPRSTRSTGLRSFASSASASTTCSSVSTSRARGSICPRCPRSSPSSMPTRRSSCAARRHSSRRRVELHATPQGKALLYADKRTEADHRGDGGDEPSSCVPGRLQRGARDHAETIVKASPISQLFSLEFRTSHLHGAGAARPTSRGWRRTSSEGSDGARGGSHLAAEELRCEYAAKLRDEIKELRREVMASPRPPDRPSPHNAICSS